jgi:hypothetical protein
MRFLYVILFYVIFSFTDIVLALIALVQCVAVLLGYEPLASLKSFGASLGVYLKQISEFLSFNSDEKPYPFSDWPVVIPEELETQSSSPSEKAD